MWALGIFFWKHNHEATCDSEWGWLDGGEKPTLVSIMMFQSLSYFWVDRAKAQKEKFVNVEMGTFPSVRLDFCGGNLLNK